MITCQATAKSGKKCRNRIARGKYCYLHKKSRFSKPLLNRRSKKRSFKRVSHKRRNWRSRRSRKSRKSRRSVDDKCKKYFNEKVKKNIEEYKKGIYSSVKQALAVSYSQTRKKRGCHTF